ncbi:hypothetical protein CWB99_17640 [Pseudoalteromonas rubra]|uniref:Uncharacterized protein n=1 Tax=Pseudoalteromonas rubra TaxID=43658 RepID=A0A5S3WJ72_9GAMM|nr:hypothetical protein [Pseudoalteromonas rubra]TMP26684.1 hypothetical protein CWB99_17640 [Pseudoalteromonas rubra]TMP30660.1 hypothetical protein CWC00_15870 [Pseudoalteromonas rubra]
MTKTRNPEVTRKKLLDALQRLVEQKPERLSGKYKVNVKSVQEEAGLSLGSAYRYPDVMDAIEEQKLAIAKRDIRKRSVKSDLERLREEKAKEKALKEKYRLELEEANKKLDRLYAEQTMQLTAMMSLLDVEDRIKLLQDSKPKVIRIK